jgi:REP element-mobilizing transposase RayT
MTKYIRRNHSVHNLGYHLIISTKYRQSYLLPFESDLKDYFSIVASAIRLRGAKINCY